MSYFVVALLFALGGGGWVYMYFMRTTGSNTRNSLVAAIAAGLIIFIAAFVVLSFAGSWF